jgi:hypothetical protein
MGDRCDIAFPINHDNGIRMMGAVVWRRREQHHPTAGPVFARIAS